MSSRMTADAKSFAVDVSCDRTGPLVSRDFQGRTASAIVDGLCTSVAGGNLVRIIAGYDNEITYATRLVELAAYLTGHAAARLDACGRQDRIGG